MKNIEIIAEAAVKAGILTDTEAQWKIDHNEEIPFHTASGWKQKGYVVKKGEEGTEVKLWKKKDGEDKFYLAKAYLYGMGAVRKEKH